MQGLWLEIIRDDKGIRGKVNHAIEKNNNTVENLQIQADNQQRECDQEVVQGNATDFYYDFFLTRVGNTFMTNITLKNIIFDHFGCNFRRVET